MLITQKSFNDRVPQKRIRKELCEILDISEGHLWRIRKAQVGETGILSTQDLISLSEYFGCTIDELVNRPAAVASTPDEEIDTPATGVDLISTTSTHTS